MSIFEHNDYQPFEVVNLSMLELKLYISLKNKGYDEIDLKHLFIAVLKMILIFKMLFKRLLGFHKQ